MSEVDCPNSELHSGHWRHTDLPGARVTIWCDGGHPRTARMNRILRDTIGCNPLTPEVLERLADLLSGRGGAR